MSARDYTDRLVFIIALPRSRTAWMCEFFKPFMVTWHDPLKRCESIGDLAGKIDRALFGTETRAKQLLIADTAICFFMQEIVERFPGAKFVVIEREQRDVVRSLRKHGVYSLEAMTATYNAFRNWLYILPGMRTWLLQFDVIDAQMRGLSEFITGRSIVQVFRSEDQFKTYRDQGKLRNVQIPFPVQFQQTDWAKVRKLMAGKFSFANNAMLRGEG